MYLFSPFSRPGYVDLSFIKRGDLLHALHFLQPVDMLAFVYTMWPESITIVHKKEDQFSYYTVENDGNNVALQHAIEWGETERAALALRSIQVIDKEEFENQCNRALVTSLRLNDEITRRHSYSNKTCLGIISMAAFWGACIEEKYKPNHPSNRFFRPHFGMSKNENMAYSIGRRAAEMVSELTFQLACKDKILFPNTILGIPVLANIVFQYLIPKSDIALPKGISQDQLDNAARKFLTVHVQMINRLDNLMDEIKKNYSFLKPPEVKQEKEVKAVDKNASNNPK